MDGTDWTQDSTEAHVANCTFSSPITSRKPDAATNVKSTPKNAADASEVFFGGQVFIRTLSGKTVELNVDGSNTILDVKMMLERKTNVPQNQQLLQVNIK